MRTGPRGVHAARPLAACAAALLTALASLSGCDTEGGGPTSPSAIDIELSAVAVQVTRTVTATAVAEDRNGTLDVTWLVDGVVSGSDSTGTITQENPATYTAPAVVPAGGRVVIEARAGSQVSASDTLDILFTILYVDADLGDDGAGTGAWAAPWKTITAALGVAEAGDTVFVRPGRYDPALGETPMYDVPIGVMLRGAHRDSCTLVGGGDRGIVVSLDVDAGIEHFTVDNADDDVIAINTSFAGSIRWIRVIDPFAYAALRVASGSEAVVEDCYLENTARPLTGTGMELIWGSRATVRRCTLRGWHQGALVSGSADPLIEQSVFEGNLVGVDTVESNEELTEPDLGWGPRGSEGGNVIRGNASCGLASRTPGTIYAINNTWNVAPIDPPVVCPSVGEGCDICVTNGGTVFWCECTPP
jgi:hypothetical protein